MSKNLKINCQVPDHKQQSLIFVELYNFYVASRNLLRCQPSMEDYSKLWHSWHFSAARNLAKFFTENCGHQSWTRQPCV